MMMLGGDKKKMATAIVSGLGASKEIDSAKPEVDADAGHHAAMDEFISAVHSKDSKGAHRALMNHRALCDTADEYQAQDTAGNEANRQNYND